MKNVRLGDFFISKGLSFYPLRALGNAFIELNGNNGESQGVKALYDWKNLFLEFCRRNSTTLSSSIIGDYVVPYFIMQTHAVCHYDIEVSAMVDAAIKEGAVATIGGKQVASELRGYYYPPTVLKNASANMACGGEEIFGPVAPIIKIRAPPGSSSPYFNIGPHLYISSNLVVEPRYEQLVRMLHSVRATVDYVKPEIHICQLDYRSLHALVPQAEVNGFKVVYWFSSTSTKSVVIDAHLVSDTTSSTD
ncbi:hypothetical protein ACTXT7_011725 [Hymenolepis weldensis]